MNNTQSQDTTSFLDLISDKSILIPIIQRDYAQGRLDKKTSEIREGFLTSIIDVLINDSKKPLSLDFIYGSTENDIFTPLDGQQRLTTLFLLHWYLLPMNEIELLRINGNPCISRFSYETRISSKKFCNALVNHPFEDIKEKLQASMLISEIIKDQSWFMWTWKKDPTIKSMLVMLDELHEMLGNQFAEDRQKMWEKLKNKSIVFHLLPLEEFSLTDELYVKMNARGKELSPFDIFKSTLEEQMKQNKVDEEIQNKWKKNIDSYWIDLFWNKLAKPCLQTESQKDNQKHVDNVEEAYLRFFERMIVFHLFRGDNCITCDWNDKNIYRNFPFECTSGDVLDKLREYSVRNSVQTLMPLFCKTKFFSDSFFEFINNFFDSLIYLEKENKHEASELVQDIYFDTASKTLFETFIADKIEYDTRVQFYALLQFVKYNKAEEINKKEDLKQELYSWMRIIRNISLTSNTNFYNTYENFLWSLEAIQVWAKTVYGDKVHESILDYFNSKDENSLTGFAKFQLNEEIIKAKLIKNSTDTVNWKDTILNADSHKYFLGQILFLLNWSKDSNDNYNLETFKRYFKQISSLFDDKGLKSEFCNAHTHIFRNLLLCNSNYLFKDSFIENTGKSRDWSWKRYLREDDKSNNIKIVLDQWNNAPMSFEDFYKTFETTIINDWRKYFIDKPDIYNVLEDHKISSWNLDNGEIRLLRKTKLSSIHRELRTFYWYLKFNGKCPYSHSHNEQPLTAFFIKPEGEISVQYIPLRDTNNSEQKGCYKLCSDYNPNIVEMKTDENTGKWTACFDSTQIESLENILNSLLGTH